MVVVFKKNSPSYFLLVLFLIIMKKTHEKSNIDRIKIFNFVPFYDNLSFVKVLKSVVKYC